MSGPNPTAAAPQFAIGDWTLDVGSHRLRRGNETRLLEPKDLAVLLHLVEAAPNMVPAAELLARNWAGTVVGDNALHQVIGRLRRALGDRARQPKYIETLSRSGYRLIAAIGDVGDNAGAPPSVSTSAARAPILLMGSIAVIAVAVVMGVVFRNVDLDGPWSFRRPASTAELVAVQALRDSSPDGSLGWLARGIPQELAAQIDATQMYDALPMALLENEPKLVETADFAITGSLAPTGRDEVTVTIDLALVPRKQQLWSQSFAGHSKDPHTLLANLATQIARYVTWSLGAVKWWGPTDQEAYVPFFKYLHLSDGSGTRDDELYWLRRTLEVDPDWAEGWENLSGFYQFLAALRNDSALLQQAEGAAVKSRRLAKRPETGLVARAYLEGYWKGDLAKTEQILRTNRTKSYLLDFHYARLMRDAGLYAEAERYFRYYLEDPEPHDVWGWFELASTRALLRDVDGTLAAVQSCLQIVPPDTFVVMWPLIWALPAAGRLDEANELVDRIADSLGRLPQDSIERTLRQGLMYGLAFNIAMKVGDRTRAESALEHYLELPYHRSAAWLMLLRLDDPRAEEYMRLAAANAAFIRNEWRTIAPYIPDDLRKRATVRRLIAAVGFTPEWRLELCRRASTFPAESHVSCNPADYETRVDL